MKHMTSQDVLDVVDLLEAQNIEFWLDGGWGVDALLGEQTRPHADLDIAVKHADVSSVRGLLATRGYHDVPKPDSRDWNFVLGDAHSREVDVHSFTTDSHGKHVYGIEYPEASLTGAGFVAGRPVRCISLEYVLRFRAGYLLSETDVQDIRALQRRFGS